MELEEEDDVKQLKDMTGRLKNRIAKIEKFVGGNKNGSFNPTKSQDDSTESMIEEGDRVLKMTIPTLVFLRIPLRER